MRRPFTQAESARGAATARAHTRADKAAGMAAAVEWRESRRCPDCRALAYQPCVHRPNGFGSVAIIQIEWPVPRGVAA